MSLNRVEVEGGLTREPEVGFSEKNGAAYWRASLAVNDTRYDSQSRSQIVVTTFVTCMAFGWKAEQLIESGVTKGDELYVRGKLDQSTFEKKDGTKESKTRVEVKSFDVVRRAPTRVNPSPSVNPSSDPWPAKDPWADSSSEPPF